MTKNVLIVDDEKPFLLSVVDGLADPGRDFRVHTAFNGREAVEVLESTRIDLLVTDLKMPVMDGFELLAHMTRHFPGIPVIVMTAFGTQEIEERLKRLENFYYLEKPLDLDHLARTIEGALESGSRSYIRGITLAAFLQLVQMEQKTCTLKIKSPEGVGFLYIRKGQLLDAETEQESGLEAAYRIVCWIDPEIEMEGGCRRQEAGIEASLEMVLLEAFRLKDEGGRCESPSVSPAAEAEEGVSESLRESSQLFYGRDETESPSGQDPPGQRDREGSSPAGELGLAELLAGAPGVLDFGIFDGDDRLVTNPSGDSSMARLRPSGLLEMGKSLEGEIEGGALRGVLLKTRTGKCSFLFRQGATLALASIKAGVRPLDFLDGLEGNRFN